MVSLCAKWRQLIGVTERCAASSLPRADKHLSHLHQNWGLYFYWLRGILEGKYFY